MLENTFFSQENHGLYEVFEFGDFEKKRRNYVKL